MRVWILRAKLARQVIKHYEKALQRVKWWVIATKGTTGNENECFYVCNFCCRIILIAISMRFFNNFLYKGYKVHFSCSTNRIMPTNTTTTMYERKYICKYNNCGLSRLYQLVTLYLKWLNCIIMCQLKHYCRTKIVKNNTKMEEVSSTKQ